MSISVGDRLKQLSGMSNATVGAMLLAIGTGATVGAILVNYSGLSTGTVAEHLLAGTSVSPEEHHGGGGGHGHKHGGDWYRHYKHPNESKKHRKPIAAEIREMYEAMIEVAPAVELAKINSVIAEYVEKPSIDYVNLSALIQPPAIDWIALANDLEQVYALARIYDRLLAEYEDEAAFLLLM